MNRRARTIRHKFFAMGSNKRTSLGQFYNWVLISSLDPEQSCLACTKIRWNLIGTPKCRNNCRWWDLWGSKGYCRNTLDWSQLGMGDVWWWSVKQPGSRSSLKNLERSNFRTLPQVELLCNKQKVEYEAFIAGLWSTSKLKVPELHIYQWLKFGS